jgi:hypothetical protein
MNLNKNDFINTVIKSQEEQYQNLILKNQESEKEIELLKQELVNISTNIDKLTLLVPELKKNNIELQKKKDSLVLNKKSDSKEYLETLLQIRDLQENIKQLNLNITREKQDFIKTQQNKILLLQKNNNNLNLQKEELEQKNLTEIHQIEIETTKYLKKNSELDLDIYMLTKNYKDTYLDRFQNRNNNLVYIVNFKKMNLWIKTQKAKLVANQEKIMLDIKNYIIESETIYENKMLETNQKLGELHQQINTNNTSEIQQAIYKVNQEVELCEKTIRKHKKKLEFKKQLLQQEFNSFDLTCQQKKDNLLSKTTNNTDYGYQIKEIIIDKTKLKAKINYNDWLINNLNQQNQLVIDNIDSTILENDLLLAEYQDSTYTNQELTNELSNLQKELDFCHTNKIYLKKLQKKDIQSYNHKLNTLTEEIENNQKNIILTNQELKNNKLELTYLTNKINFISKENKSNLTKQKNLLQEKIIKELLLVQNL